MATDNCEQLPAQRYIEAIRDGIQRLTPNSKPGEYHHPNGRLNKERMMIEFLPYAGLASTGAADKEACNSFDLLPDELRRQYLDEALRIY